MDLGLTGLRALVTGGTRGIGRAVVETFLAEGAAVAFCARDAAAVDATEKELGAHGTCLDVGDQDALAAWVRDAADRLGGIDIVVSNVSALAIPDTPENWAESLRVDLLGTVGLVTAALPYLEASPHASIVTLGSVSAREIDFAAGPYGTAKAAIVHYTQGLAHQLAAKGIRANSMSPGNTYFDGGVWHGIETGNPELYEMALGLNPTGRMGTPQEMARSIVFLASPASSFTSGSNLLVDGALTRGVQL
ncbi:MAG: 3-ketoacyl-ACP reductase [Mycobacterium sp.]|jgi:NAD(P)-dependent dehydrogenase (short-subunit alcohol dehydrogenase family)|nr:3-ketoacyl-ACP reductase [Mycobacterium sp.]